MAEFHKSTSFFTAFRKDYGFPIFYREQALDLFRDVGLWGVWMAYIVTVLSVTVLIALLGTRGYSRWRVTLQMIISLAIGLSIIVCVTGTYWRIAEYETNQTTSKGDLAVSYALRVGLNGANITMIKRNMSLEDNIVEYHNLKIGWIEVHQAEEEYREALMSGWPIGILKIARYISVDMGEMRYMRDFRSSGYAVWVLLWAAFAVWILANGLIGSNTFFAGIFLLGTGTLQLMAIIVYSSRQPDNFSIRIDDGNNQPLHLRYDGMYWTTLFSGIFTILIASIILVLDYLRPEDMNKFFGTKSEIHSPFDEELLFNQNKDIKGMIRSLSTKRSVHKERGGDVEKSKAQKFSLGNYGGYGSTNNAFNNSLDNIAEVQPGESDEGEERPAGKSVTVPDIHVEMADIPTDQSGGSNNNQSERKASTSSSPNSDTVSQKRSIESNQSAQSQDVESDESETSFDGGDITSESSQQGHTTLRARNSDGSNTLSTQQLITSDDKE